MRKLVTVLLLVGIATQGAIAAGSKAQYVGGSLTLPEKTKGRFELTRDDAAVFRSKRGEVVVPYAGIESIEYGQKAGRRVGAAVVVSPLFLLSKKRKHYVTVGFTDTAGTRQGAVFEIGKGDVHAFVMTLSTRSGKDVEYESEDARKNLEKEAR